MKKSFSDASELDGFDDLKEEDQERVTAAWEAGKVAPEDIPESAKKPGASGGDDDEEDLYAAWSKSGWSGAPVKPPVGNLEKCAKCE